jgi:hypothetical protein
VDDSLGDDLDDLPASDRLHRLSDGERAEYDFRSAEEAFGEPGAELVAWWATRLAERALIHPDHFEDLAEQVVVEFATIPVSTMHYALGGRATWIEDWGDSLDDARNYLKDAIRDFAGQIKAERGYGGGHHPWDDPKHA